MDVRSRLKQLAGANGISTSPERRSNNDSNALSYEEAPLPPTFVMAFGSSSNNALGQVKQGGLRTIYTHAIQSPTPPPMRQRGGGIYGKDGKSGKVLTGSSPVPTSDSPYKVFSGHDITSVITDGGRIYTWGNRGGGDNVLGHGSSGARYNKLIPGRLEYKSVSHAMLVGTGGEKGGGEGENYSVAVGGDRAVGWGNGGKGRMGAMGKKGGGQINLRKEAGTEINDPKNSNKSNSGDDDRDEVDYTVISASCGGQFTVLCSSDGTLYSSGANDAGQLGLHDTVLRRKFHPVLGVGRSVRFRRVACGLNHTSAVSVGGEVWTMGWGGDYRLGHGDCNKRTSPTRVEGLCKENVFVMDVGCTGASCSVLDDQGDVLGWGWNVYGQVGVTGGGESCGGASGGSGWGAALGGEDDEGCVKRPRAVLTGKVITVLSCGFAHVAAVSAVGEMWSWGFNEEGQCGVGHEGNVMAPTKVFVEKEIEGTGGEVVKVDTEGRGGKKLRILDVGCGHTHTAIVVSLMSGVENECRRREGVLKREAATRLLKFFRVSLMKILLVKKYKVEAKVSGEKRGGGLVEEEGEGALEDAAERMRLLEEEAEERLRRERALKDKEKEEERKERARRDKEEEEERLERERLEMLRLEEKERVEREAREERERVMMEREELRMRRHHLALEEERLRKEALRQKRLRKEEEERRRLSEEERMRAEEAECRRVREEKRRLARERREKIEEEKKKEEEEKRMAREARRIMDVKKAADRLKGARAKKAKEKKMREGGGVKRSGSAGGLGMVDAGEIRKKREMEKKVRRRLREEEGGSCPRAEGCHGRGLSTTFVTTFLTNFEFFLDCCANPLPSLLRSPTRFNHRRRKQRGRNGSGCVGKRLREKRGRKEIRRRWKWSREGKRGSPLRRRNGGGLGKRRGFGWRWRGRRRSAGD